MTVPDTTTGGRTRPATALNVEVFPVTLLVQPTNIECRSVAPEPEGPITTEKHPTGNSVLTCSTDTHQHPHSALLHALSNILQPELPSESSFSTAKFKPHKVKV